MNNAIDYLSDSTRREDDQLDGTKSPELLEREVDLARTRLGNTASELSDRLSPGELLDQALGMARQYGGEFGSNLGAQVKNNPMPMILTSVGIAWMMMSSGNDKTRDKYTDSTDTDGRSFNDAFGATAAKSRDKAAEISNRMHGATENVKESAQNARESLVQFYRDQPLIAGSLGIAIGAALGALVPPTEIEDDMLGEARDHSVDAAKSKAGEVYDKVRESAASMNL